MTLFLALSDFQTVLHQSSFPAELLVKHGGAANADEARSSLDTISLVFVTQIKTDFTVTFIGITFLHELIS